MKTGGKKHSGHRWCRSNRKGFRNPAPGQTYHEGESQALQTRTDLSSRIAIDTARCIACKKCERACPTGAITVTETARVDNGICAGCGACIKACPNKAISFQ